MSKHHQQERPVSYTHSGVRDPMIVLRRITGGIASHFRIRVTEWAMLWPSLGMGFALSIQSRMFETSNSFNRLAYWFSEPTWATLVLLCGMARLIALTINGSFRSFTYSPHLRMAASLCGIFFWSQFSLGFLISAVYDNGAWSAVIAYSTFVILELVNFFRSSHDVSLYGKR